jgi:carboxylesterase
MSVIFTLGFDQLRKQKPLKAGSYDSGFSLEGTSGASVILIHGLTGTPNEMRFLANYLNKKGYTVICPRLANHGEPLPVLKHTRWQELYRSVRDHDDVKKALAGNGPVFAAGLSMGALLTLVLADELKERISGVTCLAPTLFYDGWNTPGAKFFMPLACTPIKYFFYFKEEPPYGIRNEAIQSRVHKYYSNASLDHMENVAQYGYPFYPVTQLYQLKLLVKYLSKRLGRMKTPVQLIQAKDDDMTSIKNSKYIYDRVKSEMKEMIFLYNSYHVISVDQERDIVAEKMEGFFGRILKLKGTLV